MADPDTPPPEALDALQQVVDLLARADEHQFATPEYDAYVEDAIEPLTLAVALLEDNGGPEDLLDAATEALDKLEMYLATDWGNPEDIVTSEEGTEEVPEMALKHTHDDPASVLAGGCLPCQLAREATALRAQQMIDVADPAEPEPDPDHPRWEGPIGFEGEITGDGRIIEPNALRWAEDLTASPVPLRFVLSDMGAHDGAVVVGHVTAIERRPGGVIWGEGDFDLGSEHGVEAHRQVKEGLTTGVSMDLDEVAFEVRVAKDALDTLRPPVPDDDDGGLGEDTEVVVEEDEFGRVTVLDVDPDDEVMVTTGARIRAATLVAVPAFAGSRIALADTESVPPAVGVDGESVDEDGETTDLDEVAASAAPVRPPAAWFADPDLDEPTPLVVTDDGRVYGHLATWDTCHIAQPAGPGTCVNPPRSASGYAYFRVGEVQTAEGTQVPVGHLTLDTRHAPPNASPSAALAHYDDTGTAVADVAAGEDRHGIWVAGALRPEVTPAQVRTLRASPLSGDWRRIGGTLELVAALAVNVPGFPVPRPNGLVASGHLATLVAAGMLAPRRVIDPRLDPVHALSREDLKYLKRLAQRERTAELAGRVHTPRQRAEALRARAHRPVPDLTAASGTTQRI